MAIANYTELIIFNLLPGAPMIKVYLYPFFFLFLLMTYAAHTTIIEPIISAISDQTQKIELHFKLEPNNFVYKEYIQLSVDHPHVALQEWQSDIEPIAYYDTDFRDTKKIFNKDFTITTQATYNCNEKPNDVNLRINYYSHKQGKLCEKVIPLALNDKKTESLARMAEQEKPAIESTQAELTTSPNTRQKSAAKKSNRMPLHKYITGLIKTTEQTWIRILLVFLLGLLLSLTPCIYPMIPITIGILQAQARKSMARNILTALLYTLGLATTFAILGLLAAFAGQRIGNLMVNPWVIGLVVVLLIYVAFSLFDVYELYIPRFLKTNGKIYSGSLLSAFIFGMISGTVASPCISPGLILILTIVANLQNLILGFVLLFFFGFGLSLPLLLIGISSTTLAFLPQAGEWMVEIKHLFGFILFGMCLYFLNYILPWHILLWFIALFVFLAGIFYLYNAQKNHGLVRGIKTSIGMVLIGSSVYFAIKGLQVFFF